MNIQEQFEKDVINSALEKIASIPGLPSNVVVPRYMTGALKHYRDLMRVASNAGPSLSDAGMREMINRQQAVRAMLAKSAVPVSRAGSASQVRLPPMMTNK